MRLTVIAPNRPPEIVTGASSVLVHCERGFPSPQAGSGHSCGWEIVGERQWVEAVHVGKNVFQLE
jgi:hypothetical protein